MLPFDTVYGLAAEPFNEASTRRLYELKGRAGTQPTALVAADLDSLLQVFPELPSAAAEPPQAPAKVVETFWLSVPVLGVGFVVGIVMSLAQILTSIQDASFSAVPRLAAFLGVLVLAMPWMLQKMMSYTVAILGDLSRYAR